MGKIIKRFQMMKTIKKRLKKLRVDWFDELSEEQRKDVLESLTEANRGETISHSEAVKLFGKWGLK